MTTQTAPHLAAAGEPMPAAAFFEWLAEFLSGLAAASRGAPADEFLARAVDHADLERRLRAQERGMSTRSFW